MSEARVSIRASALIGLLLLLHPGAARAAGEGRIRALNIGLQGVMTLLSGVAQGKVRSGHDVARCLLAGSVAGYGSFQAKILVRDGATSRGWILANLAASASENAAAGRNPMAQVGYSVGPLRLRVVVPWLDRDADAYSYVDVSAYEAGALVRAIHDSDRMGFRNGMISFERKHLYPARNGIGPFAGYTFGLFPGVWERADPDLWHHEVVHAIQSLQADAVEPPFRILTFHPRTTEKRLIRFDHLQIGVVNLANGVALEQQPYGKHWTEIEAYRLVQRQAP